MDLKKKLNNLNQRRYDELTNSFTLSEVATRSTLNETEKYLVGSMEEVSTKQTEIVTRTGERVRGQLEEHLSGEGLSPGFDYQGSVTNNTHIKIYSDIDLIVATSKFFTAKNGSDAHIPNFTGSTLDVIQDLRAKSKTGLKERFPAAKVEDKSKSLCINGGSLQRPVDVVPCSWIKSKEFENTGSKFHLGIRVQDVYTGQWIENIPFMHNAMLDYKDKQTDGNCKRGIRLLKSLKEDADIQIDVSSYDICGLVYNCEDQKLKTHSYETQFQFLFRLLQFLRDLEKNAFSRSSLMVPNQTRLLFSSDGLSVSEMKKARRRTRWYSRRDSKFNSARPIEATNPGCAPLWKR